MGIVIHASESEMGARAGGVANGIRGVTARVAIGIRGVTTSVAIGIGVAVRIGVGVPALPVIPMPLNDGSRPYVRPVTIAAWVAAWVTARAAAAGVAGSISVIARVCRILRILRILRIIQMGALCGCGSGNRTEQSSADKR